MVMPQKNMRIRVPNAMDSALDTYSEKRRITKQDIIEGVLSWFLEQDALAQGMILGQVPADPELIKWLLQKLGPTEDPPGPGVIHQRRTAASGSSTPARKP